MLMKFEDAAKAISAGKLCHVAGSEALLKKLPKGKWIGGSTEYFMAQTGGQVSDDALFVTELPYEKFSITSYDAACIKDVTADAYDFGFTILIVPFDSDAHKEYAQNAANYQDMFIKTVVGWVSGVNLAKPGQTPIAVNGASGEVFADRAVALHLEVPGDKMVGVNIVNIFDADDASPVIRFREDGFSAKTCTVDGAETDFAQYIEKNGVDTKLPLIGDYSGVKINVSFRSVEDGRVNFYAPVFADIEYRLAKSLRDYAGAFGSQIAKLDVPSAAFSCNCILNFLYGELEGKRIETFAGPITFGEIAYQLVNQTLVYVTVE